MKKIITLGALICAFSNNTMSGMLRCIKHVAPRRVPIQKRHLIVPPTKATCYFPQGTQPRKNIFNIENIASEPKEELYGHLEDLHDRNMMIKQLLEKQKDYSADIQEILRIQNGIAHHALQVGSINTSSLHTHEMMLQQFLKKHCAMCTHIQKHASCLETKAKGNDLTHE